MVVADAAESLVASPDGDGAGGGGVVLGVVAGGGAVLLGGGAGALLCGSLLVGAGVVGSGAAEEVAGEPVPDVEPLGCWLPAGLLPPDALLAAAVLPGEVLPGDVVSGEVVSGDVPPGPLVPGEVEPPGEVVPGDVVPGAVLPGAVLPGALVPGLPSADMVPACGDAPDGCWIRGRGSGGDSTGGGGDPSRIASPTGVIPVPGPPTGTGGSAAVAGPVATRTAPAYPLSHIVVTSTNSPGCGDCTILPSPR